MSRFKKILKGTILAAVGLLVLTLTTCACLSWSAGSQIEEELERLRQRGVPLTLAQAAPDQVSEADNAAPLIMKALAPLKGSKVGELVYRINDAAGREVIAKAVAEQRAVLDQLHEALKRPACRYDVKYEEEFGAKLEHLPLVVTGGHLLAMDAFDKQCRGDLAGAAESAFDLQQLAFGLERDPLLVAQLVRMNLVKEATARLVELPITPAQEDRLKTWSDVERRHEALVRSIRAERIWAIYSYQTIPGSTMWVYQPYLRRDFLGYLRRVDRLETLVSGDYAAATPGLEQLEQEAAEKVLGMQSLTVGLVRSMIKAYQVETETQARLDEALMAAHVLRTGQLPSKPPADPFTGKAYGFKKTADGFAIWSAGADGVDDGGDPKKDVVWVHKN